MFCLKQIFAQNQMDPEACPEKCPTQRARISSQQSFQNAFWGHDLGQHGDDRASTRCREDSFCSSRRFRTRLLFGYAFPKEEQVAKRIAEEKFFHAPGLRREGRLNGTSGHILL